MRSVATLALALALLAGPVFLGAATAQEGEELSFTSTCQKLHCYFEVVGAEEAVEGNVSSIEWSFGPNGTTKTGSPVGHTFPEAGTYDVQVTVAGNASANGTSRANATGEVTVSGRELPVEALVFGVVALVASVALARMT